MAVTLPTGTVTFLFTDVEGSTRLWEQHPEAARQALVQHDALIEFVAEQHGGWVVRPRGEGDSRFVVFARATDAVRAAAAMQQALGHETWPTLRPLRVRMALHTGEADLRDGDYYGSAVNRCARLRAIAHGGQVLVSRATADLVGDGLPDAVALRDLGEHHLKDLSRPERVFQLGSGDFPPPLSVDALPNNLPPQTTALIGREDEVAAVLARLLAPETRLLTLVGPGGTGKTRLGIQVAAEALVSFPHGAFFAPLAPLRDPEHVPSAIARALAVAEAPGRRLLDTLADYVRDKRLLLVVDNVEHVATAAPRLGELVAACPSLRILATSREPLRLYGERTYPVPPLRLPDAAGDLGAVAETAAVRLFVERARDARPDFALTDENAAAVAAICRRLDGLPLAIELAAARVRLLPPRAMVERLEQAGAGSALRLLKGGPRDLPTRQQTLRDAIAWSHDLLTPEEQALFRRLAVFAGGWTLGDAEAVCGGHGVDVLDGLESLVAKSLVRQEDRPEGPRFLVLETIREFALEQLEASGELGDVGRRHAEHYTALVEASEAEVRGPRPEAALARLDAEQDNVRAALSRAMDDGSETPELALRLAGALWPYWVARALNREGGLALDTLLGRAAEVDARLRARVTVGAGALAFVQGRFGDARARLEEAVASAAQAGDDHTRAWALLYLGWMGTDARDPAARIPVEEALALGRARDDVQIVARALNILSYDASWRGDGPRGQALAEEVLSICRTAGYRWGTAHSLLDLAVAHLAQDGWAAGWRCCEESVSIHRDTGDRYHMAMSLGCGSLCAALAGEVRRSSELLDEAAALCAELGATWTMAMILGLYAGYVAGVGLPEDAARLGAAASTGYAAMGAAPPELFDRIARGRLDAALAALDPAVRGRAEAHGAAMGLREAMAYLAGLVRRLAAER